VLVNESINKKIVLKMKVFACLVNNYTTFYYKITYFSTIINVSRTLINNLLFFY